MGLDHLQQRQMMAESFEAIYALLTSDEPVTRYDELVHAQ